MENVVKTVLESMSSVKKPQRVFIAYLFSILMVFQGKATFKNMSRYSSMSEKRFRRWYERHFDFTEFNMKLLSQTIPSNNDRIAVVDASFMSKAGKKTDGLGWFYNGSAGKSQKGLEISMIGTVDIQANTAYALKSNQTIDQKGKSRVDLYAEQVLKLVPTLKQQNIKYLAADAYYSKIKFVSPIVTAGLHLVGKLRVDANLKWLYKGKYSGSGRPRQFDGKINFEADLGKFSYEGVVDDDVNVYSKVIYSQMLKCQIKVVMLKWKRGSEAGRALLYSTDLALDAMTFNNVLQSALSD